MMKNVWLFLKSWLTAVSSSACLRHPLCIWKLARNSSLCLFPALAVPLHDPSDRLLFGHHTDPHLIWYHFGWWQRRFGCMHYAVCHFGSLDNNCKMANLWMIHLMAKVLPVSFQQHCSIKNHHLMPFLQRFVKWNFFCSCKKSPSKGWQLFLLPSLQFQAKQWHSILQGLQDRQKL